MDVNSTDLPMEESENKDQKQDPGKESRKIDHHLQAQLFYYLKKRIAINNSFNPSLTLGESKESDIAESKNKAQADNKAKKEAKTGIEASRKDKQEIRSIAEGYKMYVTQVTAMDVKDGRLRSFSGPHIVARNQVEAQGLIDNTGLGYCEILGELIGLIDTDGNDVKNNYRDN